MITGKTEMSNMDSIIHILASLLEEYKIALSGLKDRLVGVTNLLMDIEVVQEKLSTQCK